MLLFKLFDIDDAIFDLLYDLREIEGFILQ